jgi:4-oxalocrotonate tautomerase
LPLVRIDLRKGKNATYREAIGSVVHEPLLGVGVPKLVIIQITWNEGRTVDQKKALYKAIADCLAARLSLRREVVSNRGQEGELVFRQRRRAIFDVSIHSQMR